MATALITGADSGIGKDIAILLSKMGYDIILVARNKNKLIDASKKIKGRKYIFVMDLSVSENCFKLHSKVVERFKSIDILVNNAGFGSWGEFCSSDIENDLNMIDLNIKAVHILTKLFLNDFIGANRGYILNVASLAAFGSGPLMATYYATKSYVYKLSTAINEELKQKHSNVSISAFCPGPVDTGFNSRAGVTFSIKPISSIYAAKSAVKGMFEKKMVIIPTSKDYLTAIASKVAPIRLVMKICYQIQKNKKN